MIGTEVPVPQPKSITRRRRRAAVAKAVAQKGQAAVREVFAPLARDGQPLPERRFVVVGVGVEFGLGSHGQLISGASFPGC